MIPSPTPKQKASIALVAIFCVLAWAGTGVACPYCAGAAEAEAREAYYRTSILLAGLPIAMALTFCYWLRRAARDLY